jgi:cation diffusion facilitator family transporter
LVVADRPRAGDLSELDKVAGIRIVLVLALVLRPRRRRPVAPGPRLLRHEVPLNSGQSTLRSPMTAKVGADPGPGAPRPRRPGGDGESRTTVMFAMGANLVIAAAKLVAGLLSGSSAMLAEAAHSVADTMNQVFLLVSLSLGAREPDEQHPFGYGKDRFFWAFMAAVFIFVAGAVFSVYEGVHRLIGEEEPGGYLPAYIVLAISFLAEGVSFIRAVGQVRGEAGDAGRGLRQHLRKSKDPTTKTVVFEDGAALAGLVLASAGVGLHQLTGDAFWDGLASVLIGVLLAVAAVVLGRNARGLLLGEAALPEQRAAIRDQIERHDEVEAVLQLRTMHLGPDSILVAVRVDFRDEVAAADIERLSTTIEDELRQKVEAVTEDVLDATAPRRRR